MRKRIFVFGLIFMIFSAGASACVPAAPAPTATRTNTPQMLGINQTVTYPPTYTITPSRTMYPTQIPYQTSTPVPTKTATPTRPTSTPSIYPTPSGSYYLESISPSGKWIAWDVGCQDTEIVHDACFQFNNRDGTLTWYFTVDDLVTEDDWRIYGKVESWSPDNKFVYLVTYPMDTDFIMDQPAHGIAKLSLVTGAVSYIITPNYTAVEGEIYQMPIYYSYAFSNNGQWLVYANKNGRSIDFTLLNLVSNDVRYFSVVVAEDAAYGDITWSPDDRFFVFSAAESLIDLGRSDDFSVFLVTIEDLSVKRIYLHGDKFLYYPEWISNKEVEYDYTSRNGSGGKLILNIETGEVTEVEE